MPGWTLLAFHDLTKTDLVDLFSKLIGCDRIPFGRQRYERISRFRYVVRVHLAALSRASCFRCSLQRPKDERSHGLHARRFMGEQPVA